MTIEDLSKVDVLSKRTKAIVLTPRCGTELNHEQCVAIAKDMAAALTRAGAGHVEVIIGEGLDVAVINE